MIAKATFKVGILMWSKVRNFLKKCQFDGMKIEFFEGSGIIEREFIIRGPKEEVEIIVESINKYMKETE
jgi:hypothetical protein